MKYKNIFIALLVCATTYLNAQVKVLDPDNMQPVQASESHSQSIQDILPMGNWLTTKKIDSLNVGDTIVFTNDNAIREFDLNFSKAGKVTCYTQHMDNSRAKDGSTTLGFSNSWDTIGDWYCENNQLVVFIDMMHNPPQPNHQNCKKFTFSIINQSYKNIKLVAFNIHLMRSNR